MVKAWHISRDNAERLVDVLDSVSEDDLSAELRELFSMATKCIGESEIERKVVAWAKAHDILPLKLTPDSDGGWPDHFWLFYYPAIAFIEFKAPNGRVALRQGLRIAELKRRGYPVEVIRNVEHGIAFLEATLLSRKGSETWNLPSVRRVPDVPRDGENNDPIRNLQNSEGQEFR